MEECVHDKHHQGIEDVHQHIVVTGKRPHEVRVCTKCGARRVAGRKWEVPKRNAT